MCMSVLDDGLLRLTIMEELDNLLSPDMVTRNAAEENMRQLEYIESYGIILTEITLNQFIELPLRQMAGIMLTRYAERYWDERNVPDDPCGAIGGGSVISIPAKCTIRETLPVGLQDTNSIIRSSVANTICTIADTDYPSDWADLSSVIVECLNGDGNSIHGIMQVLINFQYDRIQIKALHALIISNAFRIFDLEDSYSIEARSLAVVVLKSLFLAGSTLEQTERANMVYLVLDTYLDKMIYYLSLNHNPNSSFLLPIEIVQLLTFLVTDMTKYLENYMDHLLPAMCQLFTNFVDIYTKVVVNEADPNLARGENDFLKLILQFLQFIQRTISCGMFRPFVKMTLNYLVYPTILYLQLPQQNLEQWSIDPEKYIEDEEGVDVTIRVMGQDILLVSVTYMCRKNSELLHCFPKALTDSLGAELLPPFEEAINRLMMMAESEKHTGNANWWKIQEACFVAVHTLHDLLFNYEEQFDLMNYLMRTRSYLNHRAYPYMAGRALWTLGTWVSSKYINNEMLNEILNKVQETLETKNNFVFKINAVRTIYSIIEAHDVLNDEKRELVQSKFPRLMDGIIVLILDCASLALCLLLDCLIGIMQTSPSVAAAAKNKIVSVALEVFTKYAENPFILDSTRDLIRAICLNKPCLRLMRKKFVPCVVTILTLADDCPSNIIRKNCAVDVLTTIAQNSDGLLTGDLVTKAFPAMIDCVLHSRDNDTIVAGEKCLRAYLSICPKQVCAYNNDEGLKSIVQFIIMILGLTISKQTTIKFGPTAIAIMKNIGQMLDDYICTLLKVIVQEMELVRDPKILAEIVIVFVYLFLTQTRDSFNFLGPLSSPISGPSLMYVLGTWISVQKFFDGVYERKLNTMTLCKILEYGIAENDFRLLSVKIADGDIDRRCPMTTHMANYFYWNDIHCVFIPILAKIFKLLIRELCYIKESRLDLACDKDSDASTNSSGDSSSDNSFTKNANDKQYLDGKGCNTISDAQLTQQLLMDPLLQSNLEENIMNILKRLSVSEYYTSFANYLTDLEKDILKALSMP
uniref:Importin N-terminal domain-containing protein n=1 Tax=Glossina austeni TaxID=7395 RepID=A0A1A9UPD7_GLOAU